MTGEEEEEAEEKTVLGTACVRAASFLPCLLQSQTKRGTAASPSLDAQISRIFEPVTVGKSGMRRQWTITQSARGASRYDVGMEKRN